MYLKLILDCIVTKMNMFKSISLNFTKLNQELPSLLQTDQQGDNFSYTDNFFVAAIPVIPGCAPRVADYFFHIGRHPCIVMSKGMS